MDTEVGHRMTGLPPEGYRLSDSDLQLRVEDDGGTRHLRLLSCEVFGARKYFRNPKSLVGYLHD